MLNTFYNEMFCFHSFQPQDEEGRRRERRRRRRRGRSEPAECAECATTITTSAATTATSSRSASTGRDQNVRRRRYEYSIFFFLRHLLCLNETS